MHAYTLADFSGTILKHSLDELTQSELLLTCKAGNMQSFYTPFDAVNTGAKVVLAGICPGQAQWRNALKSAQEGLKQGLPADAVLRQAKAAGAFSGPIRANLVKILDHIGLQHKLGIPSAQTLFDEQQALVHMTSVLRQCILVKGKNYAGSAPSMLRNEFLKQHIEAYFLPEIAQLASAVYIPFGQSVTEVLYFLSSLGYLRPEQILDGFPHPSGANAERIKYFLGEKNASELSAATNPVLIDQAKLQLLAKIKALHF